MIGERLVACLEASNEDSLRVLNNYIQTDRATYCLHFEHFQKHAVQEPRVEYVHPPEVVGLRIIEIRHDEKFDDLHVRLENNVVVTQSGRCDPTAEDVAATWEPAFYFYAPREFGWDDWEHCILIAKAPDAPPPPTAPQQS